MQDVFSDSQLHPSLRLICGLNESRLEEGKHDLCDLFRLRGKLLRCTCVSLCFFFFFFLRADRLRPIDRFRECVRKMRMDTAVTSVVTGHMCRINSVVTGISLIFHMLCMLQGVCEDTAAVLHLNVQLKISAFLLLWK